MADKKPNEWVQLLLLRFDSQLPIRTGLHTAKCAINMEQNKQCLISLSHSKFSLVITGLTRMLQDIDSMQVYGPDAEKNFCDSQFIILDTLEKCLNTQPKDTSRLDETILVKNLIQELFRVRNLAINFINFTNNKIYAQLLSLTSNVIFALSTHCFNAVFNRFANCLALAAGQEESTRNEPNNELQLIKYIVLDIDKLSRVLSEISNRFRTLKKNTLLELADFVEKAIWNWLENNPQQFNDLQKQPSDKLAECCERLYDCYSSVSVENVRKKLVIWPLKMMLLVLCPHTLEEINNAENGAPLSPQHTKKKQFIHEIRKILSNPNSTSVTTNKPLLTEAALLAAVNMCKASTYISTNDRNNILFIMVNSVYNDIQNILFNQNKPFIRSAPNQGETEALLIEFFIAYFRITPHTKNVLKVCLQVKAHPIYHTVLVSSLLRIISQNHLPWWPDVSILYSKSSEIRKMFFETVTRMNRHEPIRLSHSLTLRNKMNLKNRADKTDEIATNKYNLLLNMVKLLIANPLLMLYSSSNRQQISSNQHAAPDLMYGLVNLMQQSVVIELAQDSMDALLCLHQPSFIRWWNPNAPAQVFWHTSSVLLYSIAQKLINRNMPNHCEVLKWLKEILLCRINFLHQHRDFYALLQCDHNNSEASSGLPYECRNKTPNGMNAMHGNNWSPNVNSKIDSTKSTQNSDEHVASYFTQMMQELCPSCSASLTSMDNEKPCSYVIKNTLRSNNSGFRGSIYSTLSSDLHAPHYQSAPSCQTISPFLIPLNANPKSNQMALIKLETAFYTYLWALDFDAVLTAMSCFRLIWHEAELWGGSMYVANKFSNLVAKKFPNMKCCCQKVENMSSMMSTRVPEEKTYDFNAKCCNQQANFSRSTSQHQRDTQCSSKDLCCCATMRICCECVKNSIIQKPSVDQQSAMNASSNSNASDLRLFDLLPISDIYMEIADHSKSIVTTGRAVLQKQLLALLRKINHQTQGNIIAWKHTYMMWQRSTKYLLSYPKSKANSSCSSNNNSDDFNPPTEPPSSHLLGSSTSSSLLNSMSLENQSSMSSSNTTQTPMTSQSNQSKTKTVSSIPSRYPVSSSCTDHGIKDILNEWANMTGFLCALGSVALQMPTQSQMQQQVSDLTMNNKNAMANWQKMVDCDLSICEDQLIKQETLIYQQRGSTDEGCKVGGNKIRIDEETRSTFENMMGNQDEGIEGERDSLPLHHICDRIFSSESTISQLTTTSNPHASFQDNCNSIADNGITVDRTAKPIKSDPHKRHQNFSSFQNMNLAGISPDSRYSPVATFLKNMITLLTCQHENFGHVIQRHVKEAIGNELNSTIYPILFDQLSNHVDSYFFNQGQQQIIVNETNTLFIENVIFILRCILDKAMKLPDMPNENLGYISIEGLILNIVRYVRHIDRSNSIYLKIKVCQIIQKIVARRDDLNLRKEIKFKNKLVEYLSEWVMGTSYLGNNIQPIPYSYIHTFSGTQPGSMQQAQNIITGLGSHLNDSMILNENPNGGTKQTPCHDDDSSISFCPTASSSSPIPSSFQNSSNFIELQKMNQISINTLTQMSNDGQSHVMLNNPPNFVEHHSNNGYQIHPSLHQINMPGSIPQASNIVNTGNVLSSGNSVISANSGMNSSLNPLNNLQAQSNYPSQGNGNQNHILNPDMNKASHFNQDRELDLACMEAIAGLLQGLPLQTEENDRGDILNAKSHLFAKYFALFMNLLNDLAEDRTYIHSKNEWRKNIIALRDATVQAMSNLLNANIDSGLMHSISLGYHRDPHTRAAFMEVLTNILKQGTEFETLAETALAERYERLISLVTLVSDNNELPIVMGLVHVIPSQLMDELVNVLVTIFNAKNLLSELLWNIFSKEITNAGDTLQTLLRGNCFSSKIMTHCFRIFGQDYLQTVLGPILMELVRQDIDNKPLKNNPDLQKEGFAEKEEINHFYNLKKPLSFEVDPTRIEPNEDIEVNRKNLIAVTEIFYNRLISSKDIFPTRLKCLCNCLYRLIMQEYPTISEDNVASTLSTIFFLRFINPVVVGPCENGILDFEPSLRIRRGLTLIGKMMQNIANQLLFTKEPHMRVFDSFLQKHFESCRRFFLDIANETIDYDNSNNLLDACGTIPAPGIDSICSVAQTKTNKDGFKLEQKTTNLNSFQPYIPEDVIHSLHIILWHNQERIGDYLSSSRDRKAVGRRPFDKIATLLAQLGPPEPKSVDQNYEHPVQASDRIEDWAIRGYQFNNVSEFQKLKSSNVFYQYGMSRQGNPVFYYVARRYKIQEESRSDYPMIICLISMAFEQFKEKPFELVVDFTCANSDNRFTTDLLNRASSVLKNILNKYLVYAYIYNCNSWVRQYTKQRDRFFSHLKNNRKIMFINHLSKLNEFIAVDQQKLPNSTIALGEDLKVFNSALKCSNKEIKVAIKICTDAIQVQTVERVKVLGFGVTLNDVYHVSEIEEFCQVDDNQLTLRIKNDPATLSFIHENCEAIVQSILHIKTRWALSQPEPQSVHTKIRPRDVPGTLLNIALLNLGSSDPELRSTAYNLLCALAKTFKLKIEGQLLETNGLCIPANNTLFITEISKWLARLEPHLTFEFLEECIQGFSLSNIAMKHLCLEYMTPWLGNLAKFCKSGDVKRKKVNQILDKLITLTIEEEQMYPSVQIKIWGNLAKVSDLLDMVLDCFILRSINSGLGSLQAEVLADTSVALAAANVELVSRKVLNKICKLLEKSFAASTLLLENHPIWTELAPLLRFMFMLSFNNCLDIKCLLPKLFHIATMLVNTGPISLRAAMHGFVINIIHSLCTSSAQRRLSEKLVQQLQLLLSEFTLPKFYEVFGLQNVKSAPVTAFPHYCRRNKDQTNQNFKNVPFNATVGNYNQLNPFISNHSNMQTSRLSLSTSESFDSDSEINSQCSLSVRDFRNSLVNDSVEYKKSKSKKNKKAPAGNQFYNYRPTTEDSTTEVHETITYTSPILYSPGGALITSSNQKKTPSNLLKTINPETSTAKCTYTIINNNSSEVNKLTLTSLEFLTDTLLEIASIIIRDIPEYSTWLEQWGQLARKFAFQNNPALQPRACIVLGCISKTVTDTDIKQLIRIMSKALESYTNELSIEKDIKQRTSHMGQAELNLIESIILCLTRLLPLLPSDSETHKPLFWVALCVLQLEEVNLYAAGLALLEQILSTLDQQNVFQTQTLTQSMMECREQFILQYKHIDHSVGLSFKDSFHFALVGHLLKGFRHPCQKTIGRTIRILNMLLDIIAKTYSRDKYEVTIDNIAYLAALVPVCPEVRSRCLLKHRVPGTLMESKTTISQKASFTKKSFLSTKLGGNYKSPSIISSTSNLETQHSKDEKNEQEISNTIPGYEESSTTKRQVCQPPLGPSTSFQDPWSGSNESLAEITYSQDKVRQSTYSKSRSLLVGPAAACGVRSAITLDRKNEVTKSHKSIDSTSINMNESDTLQNKIDESNYLLNPKVLNEESIQALTLTVLTTLVRNTNDENEARVLYEYLADASVIFPRVFPVIHSLLDSKINYVLNSCHDQHILSAVQSIIQNMINSGETPLQQMTYLQSIGFGGLWRFSGNFSKANQNADTAQLFVNFLEVLIDSHLPGDDLNNSYNPTLNLGHHEAAIIGTNDDDETEEMSNGLIH